MSKMRRIIVYCLCMKLAAAKIRLLYAGAAVLGLFFSLTPLVAADTYPYLRVTGGDVWTGGWFESGGSCSNSAPPYQDNRDSGGGISTYLGASGGSSGDFGVYALGSIASGGSPTGGFASDVKAGGGKTLTFANTGSPLGLFQGGTPQQHCLPDYYDAQSSTTSLNGAASVNLGGLGSQQYLDSLSAGFVSVSGAIAAGQKTTLFVKGDVHITGNITYAAGYTESTVPKFALVVKGNIFVEPNVTQIDGVYVAQPSSGSSDGVIWTCTDVANSSSPWGPDIKKNCTNSLTVNGALLAKQVNYLRINGDAGTAGSPAAETVNYPAANIVGGPFFNPPSTGSPVIQSLISLPPLF